MNLRHLQRAPFRLDARALSWVETTFRRLTPRERRAQLVVPLATDVSPENLERFAAMGAGGLFRSHHRPLEILRAEAAQLQARSAVPLLLCGDLEFGESSAVGAEEGTAYPNQLAAAAAGVDAVERMATVAAREGGAAGFNWSFTPVADLDFNPLNPVVSTRCFGNDPAYVARCVRRYVGALQRGGMAACVKHWPGDGVDDRDQHFTTTRNTLDRAAWDRTYGRVYRAAIHGEVLSVMSAHIALPAWPGAGSTPASLCRELNVGLLRKQLGFNGVVISDAACMAGFTTCGPREVLVPRLIAHGCDMILFPTDPEVDLDYLARAVAAGRLTEDRVDAAVLGVLALKAALGLHQKRQLRTPLSRSAYTRHRRWADQAAQKALVLVRDEVGLLPLDPRRQCRVLLVQQEDRHNWSGALPPLRIKQLLVARGFAVERLRDETDVRAEKFDVALYVVAEEASAGRGPMRVDWEKLQGGARRSMLRTWPELPTVFVSLGHPWHVRDLAGCPTVINGWSPVPAVQEALVAALLGQAKFAGRSPVRMNPHSGEPLKGRAD